MGIFQPGLLTDFACEEVNETNLNDLNPESNLAELEVTARAGNTVWFTAYVQWEPSAASQPFTLRIERENGTVVCSTMDMPPQANEPVTTAITCCDFAVSEGTHTYFLVGQRQNPVNIEGPA